MKKKLFPLALILALSLTACSETTRTNTSESNLTVVDTTAVSGNTAPSTVPVDPGLTLPVLDALFYEDGFADDLKNKLSLSNDQIQKLKAAAQKSVSDLDEKGDGTAYLGSARAASKNSEAQLNSILGEEKAMQLRQYVAQRYAGGDLEGLLPTQPNAVPTDTRVVVNAPAYRMDVFQDAAFEKLCGRHRLSGISLARRDAPRRENHFQPHLDATRRALGERKICARQNR